MFQFHMTLNQLREIGMGRAHILISLIDTRERMKNLVPIEVTAQVIDEGGTDDDGNTVAGNSDVAVLPQVDATDGRSDSQK